MNTHGKVQLHFILCIFCTGNQIIYPNLLNRFFLLLFDRITPYLCLSSNCKHFCYIRRYIYCIFIIYCATKSWLEQFIDFVISYLKITASSLSNIRRIRLMQHIFTILLILNSQTQSELWVTPDIIIDSTTWLLRCKYQMHTQTSPNLCNTNQFFHKFRFFSF